MDLVYFIPSKFRERLKCFCRIAGKNMNDLVYCIGTGGLRDLYVMIDSSWSFILTVSYSRLIEAVCTYYFQKRIEKKTLHIHKKDWLWDQDH